METEQSAAASPAQSQPGQNGDGKKGVRLDQAAVLMAQISAENLAKLAKVEVAPTPAPAAQAPEPTEATTESAPAEAVQEEVPSEPEAQPAEGEEGDDDLSQSTSLDAATKQLLKEALAQKKARWHAKVQKRFDEQAGRIKEAEQRAAAAEARALEAENRPVVQPVAPPPMTDPNNPLSSVQDIVALNQKYTEAQRAILEAEDILAQMEDSGQQSVQLGQQVLDKATVRSALRNAKRIVEVHAPAQARFLQAREQVAAKVRQEFAWLNNRNSQEYIRFQQFKTDPRIAGAADGDHIAALLVEGWNVVEGRKKTSAQPAKPKVEAKPKPSASQTEMGASGGASRAAESTINRAKLASETQKLVSGKNLKGSDAARFLLNRELLQQR